jgi:hypothetical protein
MYGLHGFSLRFVVQASRVKALQPTIAMSASPPLVDGSMPDSAWGLYFLAGSTESAMASV